MTVGRDRLAEIYREWDDDPHNELVVWLRDTHDTELATFMEAYPERDTFYVDWLQLRRFDMDFAEGVKAHPEISEVLAWAVEDAVVSVGQDHVDFNDHPIDVRFRNVAEPREITEAIKGDEESELITLRGQVTKATPTKPRITTAAFRCTSCGGGHQIEQPEHGTNTLDSCPTTDCKGSTFELVYADSQTQYHQLVRVKEPAEGNASDQHVDVHLTKDAAGAVDGGERIDTTGTLRAHIDDFENQPIPEFVLEGHSVDRHDSDYESIDTAAYKDEITAIANGEHGDPYNLLVDSFAHSLKGDDKLDAIKLAIILQLFGGWRRPHGDGQYARGDIHIGLIGDPGTGKSSLLNAAEALSPRSTFASGKNASKAGMTAAAVRDDFGETEWSLEAGAIVKAHKGIACVDEIDKVPGDVVSSLHTALEKQRLEVSKAGINATMKCETSLLAAGNPSEGRFIKEQPKIQQINMPPALRSRFDLLFCLEDTPDRQRDMELAKHITELRAESGINARSGDSETATEVPIDRDTMRAYIAYARERCHPVIEDDAVRERIAERYAEWRGDSGEIGGLTARMVDAANRLAEASARIRLDDTVREEDIDRTMSIIERFLMDIEILDANGKFDVEVADQYESGSNSTQRDEIKNIQGMIETLQPETGGVSIDDVIETAEDAGIDADKVRHRIKKLKENGTVYEPQQGMIRHV